MAAGETLEHYSDRRFRIAGRKLLENGHPWFVALDKLKSDAKKRGQRFTSFANYDYLGLSEDQAVKSAVIDAANRSSVGALGSRLVGGERLAHTQLEESLAAFIGAEACLTLVSGYLTNFSLVPHLVARQDLVIFDEYCHNSIISGISAAKSTAEMFGHNDLTGLRRILDADRGKFRNCLVVVEGLYSMDGDFPDLPELLRLRDEFGFWLMVDEAHSFGVLGQTGRGLCEHFGVDPGKVDLLVGTLSKALGSCGGFVCAKKSIIEWLKFTLGGFVYSVGLSPVIMASTQAALALLAAQPERVARLRDNSEYFLRLARDSGLDVGKACGAGIVPIMFKDFGQTAYVSEMLLQSGIYVPPIAYVGVPKSAPRVRFFISAAHKKSEIELAIEIVKASLRAYKADHDESIAKIAAE